MTKISGIYKIQSNIYPNKIYVGSAQNMAQRKYSHLYKLRNNIHGNRKLQNHYNKYGERDIQFTLLLGCPICNLIEHEQYFIDALMPWFNICQTAGNKLGLRHSEESKKKMSDIKMGHIGCWLGKKLSEEHRRKISEYRMGIKFSEETRRRLSESHKGKKNSEETRKRMSLAKTGHPTSIETRRKISESNKKTKNSHVRE